MHYFDKLKTKYKISRVLENFTKYDVEAKNEEELPSEKYHMTIFESKKNFDTYLKYVSSCVSEETEFGIVDKLKVEVASMIKLEVFCIISKIGLTVEQAFKQETPNMQDKL